MFSPMQVPITGGGYPTLLTPVTGRPVGINNRSKTVSVFYGGDLSVAPDKSNNGVIQPGATHIHDGMSELYGVVPIGQSAVVQVIPGCYGWFQGASI